MGYLQELEKYFLSDELKPLPASKFFTFFSYSSKFNFERFLDKEENYNKIYFSDFHIINKRRGNDIFLSRSGDW